MLHKRLICFLLALFWASTLHAQTPLGWDMVCDVTEVTVNGLVSEAEAIQAGDRWITHLPAPPEGEPPTATGDLQDGGKGSYWDLVEQMFCSHSEPGGEPITGTATQSRFILEDGTTKDAVGGDSIGAFFSVGDLEITRCGTGLRDADGQTLESHLFPPAEINLEDWAEKDCYAEGTKTGTGESMQLIGLIVLTAQIDVLRRRIDVPAGDANALITAIEYANLLPQGTQVYLRTVGEGETTFSEGYRDTNNALPVITSDIWFIGGDFRRGNAASTLFRFARVSGGRVKFTEQSFLDFASIDGGGAFLIDGNARVTFDYTEFSNNETFADGGAILVEENARVTVEDGSAKNNSSEQSGGSYAVRGDAVLEVRDGSVYDSSAGLDGGAVYRGGNAHVVVSDVGFGRNTAIRKGGVLAIGGDTVEAPSVAALIGRNTFWADSANGPGCAISVNLTGEIRSHAQVKIESNVIFGFCETPLISHSQGKTLLANNILYTVEGETLIETLITSGSDADLLGNILLLDGTEQQQGSESPGNKLLAACEGSGAGFLNSLGYNISSDNSCNLDHPTDLPNTDAMLSEPDENGIRTPLPGSPAIDMGLDSLITFEGDSAPSLPCSWRDVNGLGSPQDGDGDGGFECDSGAVEFAGAGAIQAGHSGAFFNSLRNGEGQYVEVLDGDAALIYTFTYKPDGSGPAWFLGLGNVIGNSLVTSEVNRPLGTLFGESFDTNDIEFTEWGGMSMVFPACANDEPAGNIAYSGNSLLGYDPLITKAERVSDIAGCDGRTTPHPNAGLSGSFYDPARNGEGLIVEWLPDGRVLAIMFTFDPNGQQMWMFGVAQSNGQSVTMEVFYPTGFTRWGAAFNSGDVVLESWGTFVLSWSDCNNLVFEYVSDLPGYGTATRNYQRITNLKGLDCPVL